MKTHVSIFNCISFCRLVAFALVVCLFSGVLYAAPPGKERDGLFYEKINELKEKARDKGSIPIIIKLKVAFIPEGERKSPDEINAQRSEIANIGGKVRSSLKGLNRYVKKLKSFKRLPYITMTTNEEVIETLSNNPDVISITKDLSASQNLDISIPLIGGDIAFSQGFSGLGQAIAVIDSGVRSDHEFFANKIVSEACYSGAGEGTSLCPGGALSSTATGSGEDCSLNVSSGCGHGTHVAGIAVGQNGQFSGVAKDAKLISIKTSTLTTAGEITHYVSDIASGLDRVYELRNQFAIPAVNVSLGGAANNPGTCDNLFPVLTDAINQLKSVGIATIVSSGNNGHENGMSWPACISSAVSVGSSVSEPESNFQVNDIAGHSNISAETDLLAPGTKIFSATNASNNSYGDEWGTSMSAPHIAGAFAILKSKNDALSVDDLLTALKTSGLSVSDQRPGGLHTVPRVDIASALSVIPASTGFEGLSPDGTTTGVNPTFTWTPLAGQTDYWVLADDSPTLEWPYVVYSTVSAADANCASGICSYTSSQNFSSGTSVWQVKAPQAGGGWPETDLLNFTVDAGGSTSFQGLTPDGTTTGPNPTFTWTPLAGQTEYWVLADDSPTLEWPYVIYSTISATDANCASGVCSYTASATQNFTSGTAVWQAKAPQSGGGWPETDLLNFTVDAGGSAGFQGLTPNGTTTGSNPTFTWTPLAGQTDYWVIADDSPTLEWPYVVYSTVSAADANCASGICSYTTSQTFPPGTAVWQIKAPQSGSGWPETDLLNFTVN